MPVFNVSVQLNLVSGLVIQVLNSWVNHLVVGKFFHFILHLLFHQISLQEKCGA